MEGVASTGLDDPNPGLARLDLASRTVTTWSVPSGAGHLAFDSDNNVWINSSSLSRFTANTNQLCSVALPDSGISGAFLTEHNGAFWLGVSNVITSGLARITPTTNAYTFWPFGSAGLLAPADNIVVVTAGAVAFAPSGDVWFSNEQTSTVGRLETGANRLTYFNTPDGFTMQSLDFFLGKVWYTSQTEVSGTIGYLDPATATGTPPQVVTPSTALLSPACADAGAGLTFTAGIRTGVSAFSGLPLTATVNTQGISYGTPISSQPSDLVRLGSILWLPDQGRNTLVEFVISPTSLYIPLARR